MGQSCLAQLYDLSGANNEKIVEIKLFTCPNYMDPLPLEKRNELIAEGQNIQ
jgi:hypothetical protein